MDFEFIIIRFISVTIIIISILLSDMETGDCRGQLSVLRSYCGHHWLCLQEVRDQYTAVVKLVISGDKLKLDQSHLETVIPAQGKLWRASDVHVESVC